MPAITRSAVGSLRPVRGTLTLPVQLIHDCQDTPAALGLYLLIARLSVVHQAAVPLAAADLTAYDPTLSYGQVRRALGRLVQGGWLVVTRSGAKAAYQPTWGAGRRWQWGQPRWGRPRGCAVLDVPMALLDTCMGRLDPHPRVRATVTRTLPAPALALADVGAYALVLHGRATSTSALVALGLVDHAGVVQPLPRPATLRARAMPLVGADHETALPDKEEATPPELIGQVIGDLIGLPDAGEVPNSPPGRDESPGPAAPARSPWNPWIHMDDSPHGVVVSAAVDRVDCQEMVSRDRQPATRSAVPASTSALALRQLGMYPATIRRYAHLSLPLIEAVIAYAKQRPYRDLAALVATLLWSHMEDGWTPPTPAPPRTWDAPASFPCPDWVDLDRWLAWPQALKECLDGAAVWAGELVCAAPWQREVITRQYPWLLGELGVTRLEARYDSAR